MPIIKVATIHFFLQNTEFCTPNVKMCTSLSRHIWLHNGQGLGDFFKLFLKPDPTLEATYLPSFV